MKKTFIVLALGTLTLSACGETAGTAVAVDSNAPICEQSIQAYEKAAEKYPQFKEQFLQTVKNQRAAMAKFGEAEMDDSCRKSLEKMQRMLGN